MTRAGVAAALLLVSVLVFASGALALEGPQAEYRSKAEAICAANGRASERIIGGTRRVEPKARPKALAESGRRFLKAANALGQALAKLRAIPRPEADARLLSKWLGQVSDQVTLLSEAGRAAVDGKATRAQKLINQTANGSRRANATVVPYEFSSCVLREAGFTP